MLRIPLGFYGAFVCGPGVNDTEYSWISDLGILDDIAGDDPACDCLENRRFILKITCFMSFGVKRYSLQTYLFLDSETPPTCSIFPSGGWISRANFFTTYTKAELEALNIVIPWSNQSGIGCIGASSSTTTVEE